MYKRIFKTVIVITVIKRFSCCTKKLVKSRACFFACFLGRFICKSAIFFVPLQ